MDGKEERRAESVQQPKKNWPAIIDAWRPIPRLLIGMYIFLTYQAADWFMALPDPTTQQSGFISVVIGAGSAWFGLYVNSGVGDTIGVSVTMASMGI